MEKMNELYKKDYYEWCKQQVVAISARDYKKIDWEHILEEMINMVGNSEGQLESHLAQLYMYILKGMYQPERRGNKWKKSVFNQRLAIESVMKRNPSLRYVFPRVSADAYAI